MIVQVEKDDREIRFDRKLSRISLRDGLMVYDGKDKTEDETDLFFMAKIFEQIVGSVIVHETIGQPSRRVFGRLLGYRLEVESDREPDLYLTIKADRSWIRIAGTGTIDGSPEEIIKRAERMCIDDILRRL